jgi:hypothetical protein
MAANKIAISLLSNRDIRRKINKLFADPVIAREQVETSEAMLRAGHAAGTEWEEEFWKDIRLVLAPDPSSAG